MKKEYKTPEVQVVNIKTEAHLLAGSDTHTESTSVETQNGGSFGSRQDRNFWDDEEEY